MYSPDPILILQLSDLHFGPFSRFADVPPETLGDRFSLSIGSEIRRRGLNQKVSVVVVSGDVAEAARPAEYANAEVFFATLAVKLELDRRRFVFIPGNHDVSWPACKRAEADQEEFGFNDEKLRNLIDQNKFSNFERFLDSFYEMPRAAATAAVALPDRAFVYDFNELELSVAGLNSCETESHRRQDHKGLISEPQAQALMTRWSSDEYSKWIKVIAVHHNPVVTVKENLDEIILQLKNIKDLQEAAVECYASDMLGFDGTEFLKRIVEDCEVQLLLHGHHHAADVQLWPWRRDGRGGHTHILSAGSGLLDQKKFAQGPPKYSPAHCP
jgi:3',5'-cyclic AMP phosphodiesterase CpdA